MKWYQRLLQYPELWLLIAAALFTRFWQLGTPPSIVFDEVYFRAFAGNYLSGHYFFDIHPPLAKLLFAGFASLFGLNSGQIMSSENSSFLLRIIPALAGAALVLLMYVIVRQLGFGRRLAVLGALFVLLDNALLVESRFVLMDSFLLLIGFGAVSAYLKLRISRGEARWLWVVVLGMLLGALVSIKWTGFAILALLAVAMVVEVLRSHRIKSEKFVLESLVIIALVCCIYIVSFWVHFSLLPKSGDGDAFMTRQFQSTLVGSKVYDSNNHLSFLDKFIELNSEMYSAQNSLKNVTHPYASHWYSWPIMARPVYYWQSEVKSDGSQAHIYLLGNPFVWAMGLVSVVCTLILLLYKPLWLRKKVGIAIFLFAGYVANFLPFIFIDRPMFLYHYLFALVFSLLLACLLLSVLFDWLKKKHKNQLIDRIYWGIVTIVVAGFLFLLPISYGWQLHPDELIWHMWLPTWR